MKKLSKLWQNKTFRILLLCALALILLLAVWAVFFGNGKEDDAAYKPTEQEIRLASLLERVEGVEEVTVMIGQENGAPVNVIVVFGGQDGFVTRMRIVEVASKALLINPSNVLVYPA